MSYWHWLVVISLVFILAERLAPLREGQRVLRRGWLRDVAFLALNGHFFLLWTAALTGAAALAATKALREVGLQLDGSPVAQWPIAAQFVTFLVLSDFLQWVYKTIQWLPPAWLNASPGVVLAVAVVTTVWGDFNHANFDVVLGRLGYVLNSPRMHLWHHDQSSEGGTAKNSGIVLSVWDHIFHTAYWPRDRSPEQLGYPGMAEMPPTFHGQALWPVTRVGKARAEGLGT